MYQNSYVQPAQFRCLLT